LKKIITFLIFVIISISTSYSAEAITPLKPCSKKSLNQLKNNSICKKIDSVYRWIPLEIKETKPVDVPKTTLDVSKTNTNFLNIRNNARTELAKKIVTNTNESFNSKYLIAPTVQDFIVKELKKRIDISYVYWKDTFVPTNANIVIWDTDSKQWADTTYEELKGGLWNKGHRLSDTAQDAYTCNNAFSSNFMINNVPKYIIVSCDNNMYLNMSKFKMAHEYTHWVQDGLGLIQDNSPIWLIEGSAHFYGQSIGFNNSQELFDQNRKNLISSYDYNKNRKFNSILSFINTSKNEEFVSYMETLEKRHSTDYDLQASYLIGSVATEYLIGKYGEAKLLLFWKEYKVSSNTNNNLKKVYGISSEEFYINLKEYAKYHLGEIK